MVSRLGRASWATLVAFGLAGACGGTAIIDPPDDTATGGGGSQTTSSTTANGGSTSVSSGCDCVDDFDCPQNIECQSPRCEDCECSLDDEPDGTPCSAGVCADGQCVGCLDDEDCGPGAICAGGSCIGDLFAVCDVTCNTLEMCVGGGPECFDACVADLSDCSDAQIAEVAQCTDLLVPACDLDPWIGCMEGIGCLDF